MHGAKHYEEEVRVWKEAKERREAEERQRRKDEKIARRKAKLQPLITALEEAVADSPQHLRELVLDYEWKDEEDEYYDLEYILRSNTYVFRSGIVESFIRNMLITPSTISSAKIRSAVASIKERIDILATCDGFENLSFFTSLIESRSGWKQTLLQKMLLYCREKDIVAFKGMSKPTWRYNDGGFNDAMFSLLQEKKFFEAGECVVDPQLSNPTNSI